MTIYVAAPLGNSGPRIVVEPDGPARRQLLTISEATDLYRKLGDALLIAAKRHGEIDPRILEDDA